ncbi:hypothetical protein [Paenibacillus ottowii]
MVNNVLSKYHFSFQVSYLPYFHGENEQQLDLNIRLYVLTKTLKGEPLNPDDFVDYDGLNKGFKQREISDRVKDIKKVYDLLLPAYKYRIMAIKGDNFEETKSLYNDCLGILNHLFWNDRDINKTDSIRLCEILSATKIYRETKIALSNLCAYDCRLQQFILEILKSISDGLIQHPTSAAGASEVYIQCAQIGQRIQTKVL